MSRRREVETHLGTLGEIREIMAAMKNLSFMETRKLSRFLDAQRQVVRTIEAAAADFIHAFPDLSPRVEKDAVVHVLVGAERGFCGDYNEALLQYLASGQVENAGASRLIVVGSKLGERLEQDTRVIHTLAGASVAEEVPTVLRQVVDFIEELETRWAVCRVSAIHHAGQAVKATSLLPPFQDLPASPQSLRGDPFLYLQPSVFIAELTDHYLFAALHALFYSALYAEHQKRIQHLEGALKRLDDQCDQLKRRRNVLRQEEITEEIEQILLSAQAMNPEIEPS